MVAPGDLSTKFALDLQAIDGLRITSKQGGQAGLEAAARQFEALFLNMLLKSMRDATSQDGLMESEQSRLYTSMLDQQLSQTMAARGVGLAEIMMRQLGHALPAEAPQDLDRPSAAQFPPATRPQQDRFHSGSPEEDRTKTTDGAVLPAQQKESAADIPPLEPAQTGDRLAAGQNTSGPGDFHNRLMAYAQQASQATGIPAQFLLGQAALESGWGRRELRSTEGMPSYNLFGIKAGPGWTGRVIEATTTEYVDGVARKTVERFRAYHSYADAFRDYANLLLGNSRYAGILAQARQGISVEQFAQGLQRAGYATDPNYAEKLTRIIRNAG